jgi:hypothetical protein
MELMATDKEKEIENALNLILEDLTDVNAHTIAALLENHYRVGWDSDKMLKAYKAAQWEIFGTQ